MVNLPIPSSAKKISFNGKRSERKQFEKGLEELMMKLSNFNGSFKKFFEMKK